MGISELAAALKAEAAKLEEDILAQAHGRGEAMLLEAEEQGKRMDAEAERILRQCRVRDEALRDEKRTIARRKQQAAAENIYIAAVREKCREMYRAFMEGGSYPAFIATEYAKAEREMEEVEEIRADKRTAAILQGIVGGGVKISADGPVQDGFVAHSPGGRIRIYCTFDSRFEKMWRNVPPELVRLIAKAAADGI